MNKSRRTQATSGSLAGSALGRYGYLVPIFVLFILVELYPFVYSVVLSFWNKHLLHPNADQFIGLGNYIKMLQSPHFIRAIRNSTVFTVGSVVFEYLVGLGSALILNSRHIKFRNLFRAIVLLPWVVPIAVNSLIWKFMLSPNFGFINQLLAAIGFPHLLTVNWLGDIRYAMPAVIFVNVWRSFPFYTITLLAGLAQIPSDVYEAASIDGASKWQSFIHITLPGIRGVSQVIVVLHIIWTFVNFDVIYLLTKGGPLRMTEVVPTLLYREAFDFFNMGYAAAMGVFLLVVLAITVGRAYTKTSSFQ